VLKNESCPAPCSPRSKQAAESHSSQTPLRRKSHLVESDSARRGPRGLCNAIPKRGFLATSQSVTATMDTCFRVYN